MSSKNYGRVKILTDMVLNGNIDHDKALIPKIIENALPYHYQNVGAYTINESWYFNDTDKILSKQKFIRPEIDNKFTFATAKSVVEMNNGYCFGEPFKYVTNEAEINKQDAMTAFNKCLKLSQNHQHTRECAKNGAKFGISYKLALKPTDKDLRQGRFFRIVSDIDNFHTFKVYTNTIEKEEVLGVTYYDRRVLNTDGVETDTMETVFNCWTKYHQWTFVKDSKGKYTSLPFNVRINNVWTMLDAFPLNVSLEGVSRETLIPLQEYQRTDDRVADFELSIKLMDAINVLASCRIDSVQQSTDFIIKLRDIDLGEFDEKGENKVLESKQHHSHSNKSDHNADNTISQNIEVIPKGHYSRSFLISFTSSSTSFSPCLKLLTPLPRPRINSGIFLPPKRRRTTSAMIIHSQPWIANGRSIKVAIIQYFLSFIGHQH